MQSRIEYYKTKLQKANMQIDMLLQREEEYKTHIHNITQENLKLKKLRKGAKNGKK